MRNLFREALGVAASVIALTLFVLAVMLISSLCGCVSVTATRTLPNGVTEKIEVHAFLENITDGTYSNGNGMTLSTSSATPDQQSIAVLAGTVADLGKTAMVMAARPGTNAGPTIKP